MDTAQNKISRLDRSIARGGESVTIERLTTDPTTGASSVAMSIVVPAWIRSSEPQDLLSSEARDMQVVISSTVILAPMFGSPAVAYGLPLKDDRIIIQGNNANIEDVMPIYYGGTLVRVNLVARG